MLHRLTCHPALRCPAVERIEVELDADERGACRLRYRLHGDALRIVTPSIEPHERRQRRDELWRHTCCELFVGDEAGTGYCEYNFAPSGHWAAYRFSDYRAGMAPLDASPPRIALERSPTLLALTVTMEDLPFASLRARAVGLACIVETASGLGHGLSYWALAHPAGGPDFHARRSFVRTGVGHEHEDDNEHEHEHEHERSS